MAPAFACALLVLAMVVSPHHARAKGMGKATVAVTPDATMVSLSAATAEISPVFSALYFNPKSPAYQFVLSNLAAHTFEKFTIFFPTDAALAKWQKHVKNSPANCPPVPMRNILAQQLVPGYYTAEQLKALGAYQAAGRAAGKRKQLLPTMSPMAMSVLSVKPLTVGLLNNGYDKVMSQANIIVPNAVVTKTYVLHLVDNVLTACL